MLLLRRGGRLASCGSSCANDSRVHYGTIYVPDEFWRWMTSIARLVCPPPGIVLGVTMEQVHWSGEDNLNYGHEQFLKIRLIFRPFMFPAIFWVSDFYLHSLRVGWRNLVQVSLIFAIIISFMLFTVFPLAQNQSQTSWRTVIHEPVSCIVRSVSTDSRTHRRMDGWINLVGAG